MDRERTVEWVRSVAAHETFDRRCREQAAELRDRSWDGADPAFALGLELEGYAVDGDRRLVHVPEAAFGCCERELGRHNAELNTDPTGFSHGGVGATATGLGDRLGELRDRLGDRRFVTDGLWTTAPAEGAVSYLTRTDEAGYPANMSPDPRYHALDADITAHGPVELSVPGAELSFDSILVESLATSMQVHLQPPAGRFPAYFDAALRTAGPVLALAANSPLLPPELYEVGESPAPETVLSGMVALRVPVFESMNVDSPGKVRFPEELGADGTGGALDRLLDDRTCVPLLREWVTEEPREGFADRYWELLHRQGTCWRWVRPVLDPAGPRLEYRLLAAQPAVEDVVSLTALVAGLVHGLVLTDHPVLDLPWEAARESFYAAARDGFGADLAWVTADGERVDDSAAVYPDLFATARAGLENRGLSTGRVAELLDPVEARWRARTSPADWKRRRVREALAAGADLGTAIETAGHEYVDRAAAGEPFAGWL
jgi:hypothetical protein